MDMAKYLKENQLAGCVIVLGPQAPPMEYYQNLISIVSNSPSEVSASQILDFDDEVSTHLPVPIGDVEPSEFIGEKIREINEIIVQGPPGTGKTIHDGKYNKSVVRRPKECLGYSFDKSCFD